MKKIAICLLAIAAIALSCKKSETASVNVTPSYALLSYKGGTVETNLVCNTGWSAKVDSAYKYFEKVVVTPDTAMGDHKVKITIPENDEYQTQAVRITFTASNGSSTYSTRFVVSQESNLFVTSSPEYLMIDEKGGGLRFDIISNGEWEFAGQSLVEEGIISDFFPVSGKFNTSAGVTVLPNTTGEPRTIEIPVVISSDKQITGCVTILQTVDGIK